ncbi:MAG: sigma 54-interacting transcriptional regulator [Planctomycetota bacterium]|jgi:transcriptional regulator with GAF, ATPase, and Fis domain
MILIRMGRDGEALGYTEKALEMGRETGNRISQAFAYSQLYEIYYFSDRFEKALESAKKGLEIFEELDYANQLVPSALNTAWVYVRLGKLDEAYEYAKKASDLAHKLGHTLNLPYVHEMLGEVLAAKEDPLAREHFEKSIEILKKSGKTDPDDIEFVYLKYGRFLLRQGNKEGANFVNEAARILAVRRESVRAKRAFADAEQLAEKYPDIVIPRKDADARQLERDRNNLKKVLEISLAINSETETEKLHEMIMEAAVANSGAERGFLLLIENGKWRFTAIANFIKDIPDEPDYPIIREVLSRVASGGAFFTTINIGNSTDIISVSQAPRSLRSVFAFPLSIKDDVIGVIYLDSRFAAIDLPLDGISFMVTLAQQCAHIIEKTRLFDEVRKLSAGLERTVERQKIELIQTHMELDAKQQELETRFSYHNIIGKSPKIRELFRLLDKVIETNLPVTIFGESGTGKELVAKAIHYNSPRKNRHFVAVNCAAIPETLLESELFGYEKGAFTGADTAKPGLFETASGGTLMLDEIGDMSPMMQKRLLRVVQENEIRRIGATKPVKVDVRIISASNRRLRDLVADGSFREDLFYRLNVIQLELPPLRDRLEDIQLLFEHFWERITGKTPAESPGHMQDLVQVFMNHDWPGNVREFENEINRLAFLGEGAMLLKNVSRHILEKTVKSAAAPTPLTRGLPLTEVVQNIERSIIIGALRDANANRSHAAEALSIPRTTLRNRMKKLKIKLSEFTE